jgi:hypothetical protein
MHADPGHLPGWRAAWNDGGRRAAAVRWALAAIALGLAAAMVVIAVSGNGSTTASARAPEGAAVPGVALAPRPFPLHAAPAPRTAVVSREGRPVQLGRPGPSAFPIGSPERAAAAWLAAWHARAWASMRLWNAPVPAPAPTSSELRRRFGATVLDGWSLRESRTASATATVHVLVAVHPSLRASVIRQALTLPLRRAAGVWKVRGGRVPPPFVSGLGR